MLAVFVGCVGAVGLKKPDTALVALVEGSGFGVGIGRVVEVGLAKKLGTAGSAGVGTVVEDVGAGVGVTNRFFVGSLVSVVVVVAAGTGFGCMEAAEAGVGKDGIVELVVVAEAGAGVGSGEGFFSSAAFFVSWSFCLIFDIASASMSCFSHFENDLTCFNLGESKLAVVGVYTGVLIRPFPGVRT